jgi:anti-sigma factor RsiW
VTDDAPLTESQRLLTAFLDDELAPAERLTFERQIAADPELAREVARHRSLIDMAQGAALAEPTDHEVRRFWARFYNRTEWQLGWVLLTIGLLVLAIEGAWLLLTTAALGWLLKAAIISTATGAGLLLWNTMRLKLRTSHFDRYRGVMR